MKKPRSIRWNREQAATEFNINPRTLTNRLRQGGIEPDADGLYSTQKICAAVFGDYEGEKLRLTKEQADKLSIENEASRGKLVSMEEIVEVMQRGLGAMTAGVMGMTDLNIEHRETIIKQIRACGDGVVKGDGNSLPAT